MKFAPLLLSALFFYSATPAQAQAQLPHTQLTVGMYVIKAELAVTPEERAQGLMFRERMAHNEGMAFDFGAAAQVCMWMKNTLIPLSVAFIGEDRRIINIEDMQPHSEESHCGKRPVRYALEMNQGWFKQKNIKPGMQVDGLPK